MEKTLYIVCADVKSRAKALAILAGRGNVAWIDGSEAPEDLSSLGTDERAAKDKPNDLLLVLEGGPESQILSLGGYGDDADAVDHPGPVMLAGPSDMGRSGLESLNKALDRHFGPVAKPEPLVDLAGLKSRGACAAGLEWFSKTFGPRAKVMKSIVALALAPTDNAAGWTTWLERNYK